MVTDSSNTTWCVLPGFESNWNVGADGHLDNWAGAVWRPVTCWHLIMVVDHDRGVSWRWILMTIDYGDIPLVMVDPGRDGCWTWTMITTRLLDIQYVHSDALPLLTIIQWKYIFLMFSITNSIYCTSVRPVRRILHVWLSLRFLHSFSPVKSFPFVDSYSCWGWRTEDVTPC